MKILEFFSKYQKLIIFSSLSLAVLFLIDRALGVGTIFVFFLASISLFIIGKYKEEKQSRVLGLLFLVVFSLHVMVVLFMYYAHFQPFSGGYGDYVIYQQQAQAIAAGVHQGNFTLQGINFANYYPVIVGYIYALTVPSMLIGQLFNAWLVALSIIFVYLIIREIGGTEKQGFLSGLIASVYPSLVFYGSLLLKDTIVVFLCMAGLLLIIKIIKNFSVLKFLGFFIILTGLIHFRFYIGYALMIGFIVSWFLVSNINLKKRIIYGMIMVFILGFCPQLTGNSYYGFINFKSFLNVKTITYYREIAYAPPVKTVQPTNIQPGNCESSNLKPSNGQLISKKSINPKPNNCQPASSTLSEEVATSSVIVKTGFKNPITFIENTTLSFVYSLLGPFPWQIRNLRQSSAFLETFPWYLLLFFIINGIIKSIKKRQKIILPLLIFSLLVLGVLAIFIDNFGIITRIRVPAFLSLLCLFPLGFKYLEDIKIPLFNKIFDI